MTDQAIRVIRAAYTAENVTVYQACFTHPAP